MKCAYFEKECTKGGAGIPCINCMRGETYYDRKIDYDRKKVEDDTISITKDELMRVQAKALAELTLDNPMIMFISGDMISFAARTVKLLFDKEDKS